MFRIGKLYKLTNEIEWLPRIPGRVVFSRRGKEKPAGQILLCVESYSINGMAYAKFLFGNEIYTCFEEDFVVDPDTYGPKIYDYAQMD